MLVLIETRGFARVVQEDAGVLSNSGVALQGRVQLATA